MLVATTYLSHNLPPTLHQPSTPMKKPLYHTIPPFPPIPPLSHHHPIPENSTTNTTTSSLHPHLPTTHSPRPHNEHHNHAQPLIPIPTNPRSPLQIP